VDYAKLLEMDSFFTCHIFLQVGKTQDLPSKIWQTVGDALSDPYFGQFFRLHYSVTFFKCQNCSFKGYFGN
jgi:hypothetical protein